MRLFTTLCFAVSVVALLAASSQYARAADVETRVTHGAADATATAKVSGWQIESRPVWRLQLPASGAGGTGFGTAGAGGLSLPLTGGGARSGDDGPESGAIIGYQYGIGGVDDREAVGVNLHLGSDTRDAYERMLLQPGLEYQTALTSGLQLNARVFSTYASDSVGVDRRELSRNGGDGISGGGFRDIGLGVGMDYNVTERWIVQTQAGIARQLDETRGGAKDEDAKSLNQFFGGVVVNYRF